MTTEQEEEQEQQQPKHKRMRQRDIIKEEQSSTELDYDVWLTYNLHTVAQHSSAQDRSWTSLSLSLCLFPALRRELLLRCNVCWSIWRGKWGERGEERRLDAAGWLNFMRDVDIVMALYGVMCCGVMWCDVMWCDVMRCDMPDKKSLELGWCYIVQCNECDTISGKKPRSPNITK